MRSTIVKLYLCIALLQPALVGAADGSGVEDPMNYPMRQYGFILSLALLGGIVSWYAKVRKGELPASSMSALVGELTTSALAGLLTFFVCKYYNVPPPLMAAIVGVAGHMGTKLLTMAEKVIQTKMDAKVTRPPGDTK